ncbi:hypothetical protein VTI74DRAFT_9199 [Chaetomium olivicolor]
MKSMAFVAAALAALADAFPDQGPLQREWHAIGDIAARQTAPKGVEQPITPPQLKTPTVQGCFKSSGDLKQVDTPQWNSQSYCGSDICASKGFPVGGTMGGNQCWCGNTYPPKADLVDDKNCNVPCTGYGEHACGGIYYWTIYNTGLTLLVNHYGEEQSTSKSGISSTQTSTTPPTPSSTIPQQAATVSVTVEPTNGASNGSGGTNVGGIVAGVVVGVLVIAGAIGGGFLYMRRKRNREIEEEHRRNAAVSAFIGKPPSSSGGTSMTDARLDPVLAHRRLSDGSIADNQDYSRRILRVTNA